MTPKPIFLTTVGRGLCTRGVQSSARDRRGAVAWGPGPSIHPFAFQLRVEMWGQEEPQQRLTDEAILSKAVFGSTNPPHLRLHQNLPCAMRQQTPDPHPPATLPVSWEPATPGTTHIHINIQGLSQSSPGSMQRHLTGSCFSLGRGATKLTSWELWVFWWVLNFLNDADSKPTGTQVQGAGVTIHRWPQAINNSLKNT